ncbi:hypothetical protein FVEG_13774 [Fusarium verticillioides 7600]|uniref:Uncharacterized protein n=1 Tax=Gibberella moniliformis (strain M3125 / FGSC 7600) TaxID=334819 RepID=W7MWX3_GIBM7|nr:hypothetical protein FVEG_13774 [Fusarium verticillioides 7600]EWG55831.1 hypothetical protein FVEG_13774 [Fusarium verticillioides 7600]
MIVLSIVLLFLTAIVIILRCFVRLKFAIFGLDDGLMLAGWLLHVSHVAKVTKVSVGIILSLAVFASIFTLIRIPCYKGITTPESFFLAAGERNKNWERLDGGEGSSGQKIHVQVDLEMQYLERPHTPQDSDGSRTDLVHVSRG